MGLEDGLNGSGGEATPLIGIPEGSERSSERTPGIPGAGGLSERSAAGSVVSWDPLNANESEKKKKKSRKFRFLNLRLEWTDSLRERPEVLHGDVYPAAFLLRDVVLGSGVHSTDVVRFAGALDFNPYSSENHPVLNQISRTCRWLLAREIIYNLAHLTSWVLALLSFVEPPPWCTDQVSEGGSSGCELLLNVQGVPAFGDEEEVQYYPNTGTMLLNVNESLSIECVCIAIIVLYIALHIGSMGLSASRYFFIFGKKDGIDKKANMGARIVRIILVCSVLALICGLISARLFGKKRPFALFSRLLIVISFSKGTQREIATTIRLIPDLVSILFLLLIVIVFYAWIGVVAFFETPEGTASFSSLVEGMWTLWICVTTANYPDVIMPGYNEGRVTAFYFITFMIITFFFLMNIILATVVNGYNDEADARKQRMKDISKQNLKLAFRLLDTEKRGWIDREAVMSVFLVLNEDCPEIRHIPPETAELLFALLDRYGDDQVSEEEFMNFGKVMLIEFEKSSVYSTFIENCFPRIFNSRWYQKFCKTIKSSSFESFIDIILLLNAVVVAIQTWPELVGEASSENPHLADGMIDTVWEAFQTAFTAFYMLEVIVKIMVLGWKRYSESHRNLFDFSITILCFWATCYVYYPNDYSDSRLIRYIVTARVLRLTRVLVAMKQFQVIGRTFFDIIPAAKRIISFLFCIMYAFSALGMQLYGGYITRDPSSPLSNRLMGTEFANSEYWANSFNDMFSGMNVLFNLLVVNNWTTQADGILAVTESKLSRYFFIAFHICGVIVVNNLVVAFIIDSFLHEMQSYKETEEVDTGDAVIREDRKAYFDATEVTGTKTNLSGGYVARIRNSAMLSTRVDDELKQMFTQLSSEHKSPDNSER